MMASAPHRALYTAKRRSSYDNIQLYAESPVAAPNCFRVNTATHLSATPRTAYSQAPPATARSLLSSVLRLPFVPTQSPLFATPYICSVTGTHVFSLPYRITTDLPLCFANDNRTAAMHKLKRASFYMLPITGANKVVRYRR